MSGRPPGVARLIMVSTTLARLLVTGVALSLEVGEQALGIAAEHSFSQRPFAGSLHLPYPLLSDYPALKVIQRYTGLQPHPSDPHRMAARRTLVLIDIQGIVRWQWQGETTDFFPSALIVQKVQEMTAKP